MLKIDWNKTPNDVLTSIEFSDKQPHIGLATSIDLKGNPLDVFCRICSSDDLVKLALLVDILKHKRIPFNLRIGYLLGGRMDRRLSDNEPYTLRAICRIINSFGADAVSVFVPHSQATTDLLDRYDESFFAYLENDFYSFSIRKACGYEGDASIVFPDAGAEKRYSKFQFVKNWWSGQVVMAKDRDERTGQIRGIKIIEGSPRKNCVIVDDLCDGGRTFIEAAKTLRTAGAETVSLIVAHGIFSKGTQLEGIDQIFVTNTFPNSISTYDII